MGFLRAIRKRDQFDEILGIASNPSLRPPQTAMGAGIDQAVFGWEDIVGSGEGTSKKLMVVLLGLTEKGKTSGALNITGETFSKTLYRTVATETTKG